MRANPIACFVLASVLTASAALADEPASPLSDSLTATARTDYDVGKILFRDGDFAGALVKFQSAYDKSKDARLLYNVAASERNLHHYARALRAMAGYQKASLGEGDRKEAEQIVAALKPFVGAVAVECFEPGATITLDGEVIGQAPLVEPVLVDLGKHKVRGSKAGFADAEVDIEAKDASTQRARVVLEKPEGRLVVQARPEDRIDVDGKFVSTGRLEVLLPYGGHQLKVTAPGYRAYQSEVIIQSKQPRTMQITLEKEKGGGLPWWAWTIGGVALAGAGTATVIGLMSSGSSSTTNVQNGTPFVTTPGKDGAAHLASHR
ncbi:hypothetical protein BH11MYX4_BH11MYX4_05050 [soil metagenome]